MKTSQGVSQVLQTGELVLANIGQKRNTGKTSDFTAAATTQIYTIATLKPGDVVLAHLIRVDVRTPISHPNGVVNFKLGTNLSDALFIANVSASDATAKVLLPPSAAAALAYVNNTAVDQTLIATLTTSSGNVVLATAGEIQVFVPISRVDRRVKFLEV